MKYPQPIHVQNCLFRHLGGVPFPRKWISSDPTRPHSLSVTASGSFAAQLQVKNDAKPEERVIGTVVLYICTEGHLNFWLDQHMESLILFKDFLLHLCHVYLKISLI